LILFCHWFKQVIRPILVYQQINKETFHGGHKILSKNPYGDIMKLWRIRCRCIIATLYPSTVIYLWVLQTVMINIICAAINIDPNQSINQSINGIKADYGARQ
jgi:hypothetical protein